MNANIKEVFSSIQGEGPYIGHRQVFIRFCGCNLNCNYCDTNHHKNSSFQYEKISGSNKFEQIQNPISAEKLADIVNSYDISKHHSISLTGGEPLLHNEFLREFLPKINSKIYLETNGTMPDKLKTIIDLIDIISMDIKTPSSTGLEVFEEEHLEFIKIAKNKDLFTKVVVTSKITEDEITFLKKISNLTQLIIQPITTSNQNLKIAPNKLFDILNKIPKARIIPQTHNYIGIL